MHEETFNSHPCLLSTFTLPEFFGAKFCVTIKSKIVATKEEVEEENIFCLAPEDLERRKTINVDIADDMFKPKDETREGGEPAKIIFTDRKKDKLLYERITLYGALLVLTAHENVNWGNILYI